MASNPSGLTKTQLDTLRKLLNDKLVSLDRDIKDLESHLTEEDDGSGSPDEVDRSSYEEEKQRQQVVLDGKLRLRMEVSEAVKRMERGDYGVCMESEEPIGFDRLKAQPWTRFSLEAQQEMERRRKNTAVAGGGGFPNAFGGGGGDDEEAEKAADDE